MFLKTIRAYCVFARTYFSFFSYYQGNPSTKYLNINVMTKLGILIVMVFSHKIT